jgi:hypothetical protein
VISLQPADARAARPGERLSRFGRPMMMVIINALHADQLIDWAGAHSIAIAVELGDGLFGALVVDQ